MIAEELLIYKDTFELCKELLNKNKHISKDVRYLEYADIRKDAKNALDLIFLIDNDASSRSSNIEKYFYYLSNIKSGLRLLHETKYIDTKFSTFLMLKLKALFDLANKWKKQTKSR